MKFLATWTISQDKWLQLCKTWSSMSPQERAAVGDGVKLIGRWHDHVSRKGAGVWEANDLAAVTRYMGTWNPYMDIEITPVLDDEESAVVCGQIVADNNA